MELPWLAILQESIADKPDGPVLMSLATVRTDGSPDVRRGVCREIGTDGSLWFTSDARSGKNSQIFAEPRVAIELWLHHVRRQFRFNGTMQIATGTADRLRFWLKLATATKETFFWPEPGAKRLPGASPITADAAIMPEAFSVLKFTARAVDLLELQPTPHRRRMWAAAMNWQAQELNP